MARKRNMYRVRIAGCGTDRKHSDMATLKDDNAVMLAVRAVDKLTEGLLGQKPPTITDIEHQRLLRQFKYDLVCALLADIPLAHARVVMGTIKSHVADIKEHVKRWNLSALTRSRPIRRVRTTRGIEK
jgi:hypothetical protein